MLKKTITFNNKNISYTIFGEGQPVMFLHGFGEDDTIWQHQIDFLKNDFRLIIPQLPGTGGSALLDEMTMESMANAMFEITETEGFKELILIGHSMGGYTSLAFAEKYMERLKAFGLFHSSAFADTEEKKATRKKGIEFIKENGGAAFLKTATPNLFSEKTKIKNPELVKQTVDTLPHFSDESLIAYYEAMMQRKDRTQVLKESKVPVLFIIGKYDTAVSYEDAFRQSSMPESSYIHILENSGHLGMLEETENSNSILSEFLFEIFK